MTLRSSAALLLSIFIAAAALADPVQESPWVEVRTENFVLLSDGDESYARYLVEGLEKLRRALSQIAPGAVARIRKDPRIFVFRERETFQRFVPPGSLGPQGAMSYLLPHPDRYYAGLIGQPSLQAQIVLHKQYVHQLLQDNHPELPEWFLHGFAEFYGSFEIRGREAHIGRPIEGHLFTLNQPHALPISLSMLREGREAYDRRVQDRQHFVPQAWIAVHYLLSSSPERYQQTVSFMRRIALGKTPDEAFREAFGKDDAFLEAEIRAYVKSPQFQYLVVGLPAEEVNLTSRALAPHEVQAALGDLLAHLGPAHRGDAESRLRRALSLEAGYGPAWYSLGFLARQAGDHAAAAESLAKAVRLSPEDPASQYAYGDSLLRLLGGGRPQEEAQLARLEAATAALRRATGLQEGSADAWNRLGFALGLAPEASQEAVQALSKALKLAPGRTDIVFNLLLAHARLGDAVRVEDMWQALSSLGADESTLSRAREVRLQLRFNQANQLIRDSRFADAAGLFAQVRSETSNPELARLAAERFERVSAVAQYNRFAELYQGARVALSEGREEDAGKILEELLEIARPGLQEEVARELARRGQ